MKRYREALDSCNLALGLDPFYADAYHNRGLSLLEMWRFCEALSDFEKAASLNRSIPYLLGHILYTRMFLCQWHGLITLCDEVSQAIRLGLPASLPFPLLATTVSPEIQRQCASIFVHEKCPPRPQVNCERTARGPSVIRVAYISADFRSHPTAYLMAGVFECHDRTSFETYGIALRTPSEDAIGTRVRHSFDRCVDVSRMSDPDVSGLLRDLEIDIAIDLMGFTSNARTAILASRPAAVQVNYLGYPGTMGAPYIDYIIADAFLIPSQHRSQYAESVVYLPDCFQANDHRRLVGCNPPSRESCQLPLHDVVFCSFNASNKITPAVFAVWMNILAATPRSVLWLLGNETVQATLRREAAAKGVDPTRLVFAPRVAYEQHLARLQLADIFLDTFPFNGGATASDALWAGLPVLTCAGQTFASRMAGSLLTALGISELVTASTDDYERLACTLAANRDRLAAVKDKVARNRSNTPLFDTQRFTRNLETAYQAMHHRSQAGLPPADIDQHKVVDL